MEKIPAEMIKQDRKKLLSQLEIRNVICIRKSLSLWLTLLLCIVTRFQRFWWAWGKMWHTSNKTFALKFSYVVLSVFYCVVCPLCFIIWLCFVTAAFNKYLFICFSCVYLYHVVDVICEYDWNENKIYYQTSHVNYTSSI